MTPAMPTGLAAVVAVAASVLLWLNGSGASSG
jgi:hypothetical protein